MGQIDNFRAMASKARGFARPSKFAVRIHPPASFDISNSETAFAGGEVFIVNEPQKLNQLSLSRQHKNLGQQINLFCHSIEMPGHDLQTQAQQHGSAPSRTMVTSHGFEGNITASFYLSDDLREKVFFETWQKMAVSNSTHKANYYDDYIGEMEIFQLSHQGDSNNILGRFLDREIATYGIKVSEVFPEQIGSIQYDYGSTNTIAKLSIQFAYREWKNLNIA
tara:strand:+ start:37 stop:702 length:666 start_codon:yes stop_codon:yes gene_type:complete